jgi:hypothetical protein
MDIFMHFKHKYLALALGLMASMPILAQTSFQGDWLYEQTCGWEQATNLTLNQQGAVVKGTWADGSARGHGDTGTLEGTVKDGKLWVSFCTDDEAGSDKPCTTFDTQDQDYYTLRGNDLTWYRQFGKNANVTYEKYVTLHRQIKGKKTITDDRCPDEQN